MSQMSSCSRLARPSAGVLPAFGSRSLAIGGICGLATTPITGLPNVEPPGCGISGGITICTGLQFTGGSPKMNLRTYTWNGGCLVQRVLTSANVGICGCETADNPNTQNCCPDDELPGSLAFTISDASEECECLDGIDGTMTLDGGVWKSDFIDLCDMSFSLILSCNSTAPADPACVGFALDAEELGDATVTLVSCECDPFHIVFTVDATGSDGGPCLGTFTVTIEIP